MNVITRPLKITLMFILLIGGFLRLWALGSSSFVNNELYIMLHFPILEGGFEQFLNSFIEWEIHPPLNHFLMYIWGLLVGFDEFSQRLLSSLLGIASLYLIYRTGKIAFGASTGLLASLFLCLNFSSISLSRLATSYGWQIFFSTLSFYLLVRIINSDTDKKRSGVLLATYSLCGVMMCYIHYYLMGLIFFQLGIAFLLPHFKSYRASLFKVALFVSICFLPWVPVVVQQYPRVKTHDYPRELGETPFIDYLLYWSNQSLFIAALFALGLGWGLLNLFEPDKLKRKKLWRMDLLFGISTLLPLFTIYLISKFFTPMWNLHYLALLMPPQIIFISASFSRRLNKKVLFFIATLFVGFTSLSCYEGNYQKHYLVRVDIREAVEFVVQDSNREGTNSVTVLNYGWSQYLFDHYFKRFDFNSVNYLVESGRLDVLSTPEGIRQLEQRLEKEEVKEIWLLQTYNTLYPILEDYLQASFDVVREAKFHQARAVLLRKQARK